MRLTPNWQAGLACASGAFVIAQLTRGLRRPGFVLVLLIAWGGLFSLYWVFVQLLTAWSKSNVFQQQVSARLAIVKSLPMNAAKERALTLLADPGKFRVEESPCQGDRIAELGATLKDLFSRFEMVAAVRGETVLDRKSICLSTLKSGFIRIGSDSDFTEIVAGPGCDPVFLVDGSKTQDPPAGEGYPSVYHFLVAYYDNSLGSAS